MAATKSQVGTPDSIPAMAPGDLPGPLRNLRQRTERRDRTRAPSHGGRLLVAAPEWHLVAIESLGVDSSG
jgi:hypothetical protein